MENGDFLKIFQDFSDESENKGKKGGQFVLELITAWVVAIWLVLDRIR
jgi:hypothetical protein